MKPHARVFYWLPALVWLGIIAFESFGLSSDVTGGWLWQLAHWLHIPISGHALIRLNHVLRKVGHFTGYGVLCLVFFRAWFHTLSHNTSETMARFRLRCSALALCVTLLTAMLDEWHQSFDPTRTGTPRDVVLDCAGGVLFLLTALFVFRAWRAEPEMQRLATSN
ncbi:MAG TPA: VanZ family protein [Terriglobales bacterium]|nr:VanZ family protein [Terriglobales bacterium]